MELKYNNSNIPKTVAMSIMISTVITAVFGYTINATPFFKFLIALFCWISLLAGLKRINYVNTLDKLPRILIKMLMAIVLISFLHSVFYGSVYSGDKYVVILTNKVGLLDLVGVFTVASFLSIYDLKYLLKASIIFIVISIALLFIQRDVTEDAYFLGYVLLYTPIFIPYVSKTSKYVFLFSYAASLYAFFGGGRQIILLLFFTILAILSSRYLNKKHIYYGSLLICMIPLVLFIWSILNEMSIFQYIQSFYTGSNEELSSDSRTFLWMELFQDMYYWDVWTFIFGKGVLGHYISDFFETSHRFSIEVPILQWFLQAGLSYVVVFTCLIFAAIFNLYKYGNNKMASIASILISGFYFNCFISNLLGYNIGVWGVWCMISMAFNKQILEISDDEIALVFKNPH